MANITSSELPALPSFTLVPRPPMIPGISDPLVQLLSLVVTYWAMSGFFHILDVFNLCSKYRLHTPAELEKRNRVTRYEVFRDVIIQQIAQTAFGLLIAQFDPVEMTGREEYDIAVWAQRLRLAQRYIPSLIGLIGVDSLSLARRLKPSYPQLAGALVGGFYPTQSYIPWETATAKFIYWVGIQVVQFTVAILIVDTWQYFLHRAMHMNKFLYTTLHSRHHRLYVPYAYGALYNHPIEGFMLDTLGTGMAYLVTGMTVRQGLVFFNSATIKTVDDHCGYKLPWDPVQRISSNNAAYHDVHHQSWGIKTNFSQPYFTFWDRALGTAWVGGDVSSRYERDRISAQKKIDADITATQPSVVQSPEIDLSRAEEQARASQRQVLEDEQFGGPRVLEEEAREEKDIRSATKRSTRRKSGFDAKSLSDRVAGLHSRSPAILHTDGIH